MTGRGPCAEEGREGGQLAVGNLVLAQHPAGEFDGVHHREVRPAQVTSQAGGGEEADVEWRVVGGEHASAGKVQERGEHPVQRWRGRDHRIADAGEFCDLLGNGAVRIDQGRELAAYVARADPHRPDLGDPGLIRGPAGRLHVDDDEVDLIEWAAQAGNSGRLHVRVRGDHVATVGRGTDTPVQARR